jgi:Protein of unknown function (DUF2637)
MSDYPVTRGARPGDAHLRLRLAALTAVIVGVILVALAAFLFSYSGIHHIALQAGVAPRLARLYPLMFDAMLIVTCSGVLATRTAGWGTKTYVWACLLLVVGAVAVGDALYATGVHLTGQAARATIAVVPWVLLLLGFGIWLVMLRHWRRSRIPAAVNEAEAGRPAQADQNGHNGRAMPVAPAGQPDRTPPPDRAPLPARTPQPDRAAQAMAASAAAGGAVSWAAGRGATAARSRTPRAGIDTLLEQQAGRAPERPPAADSPAAAQPKQRTVTPGERPPAGTTAATMAGTAAAAAAGTAAGIAAGTAAGTKPGTRGDAEPGAAEATKPETTAETTPGTAATTKPGTTTQTTPGTAAGTKPGTAATTAAAAAGTAAGIAAGTAAAAPATAGTTPGTTGTTPGTVGTTSGTADAGASPDTRAGETESADPASTGQDSGGKDKAGTQNRRRRLGGLLELPADEDDGEGSVRILPSSSNAPATDAASGEDGGEAAGTGDGKETSASALTEGSKTFESLPAGTADPDPANPPAPLPHFDRPRSTPTPPRDTGADGE